jgi:hypothetical protein
MKKITLLLLVFFMPNFIFSQEVTEYSKLKTNNGDVRIPGNWQQLNTVADSGQTYLKNAEGVIIAIAQNQKKSYPFFDINLSDFENVKLFYTWDSDYYKENKFETEKLKENAELEYVIWKYNDKKLDNIFLFGSTKNYFLNLMVYSNKWSEEQQVLFLENLYKLNK